MNKKGRGIWIAGIAVVSIMCVFMLILFISALSDTQGNDGPSMSVEEMSAHCYRASELFCAGVYYTDKALTANPEEISYEEWLKYVEKADEYWDALEDTLDLIGDYADTEDFEKAFEDTEVKADFFERLSDLIIPRAYAYDSEEILKTFDGAQAGKRLKAVADLLGKDMEYAQKALKVANNEITADSWNDYGDTAMHIEQGLRVTKTAGQGCAIAAGVLLATDPLTTLQTTTIVVSGASCIWQLMDDGAFILIGDDYKSNEFVANLSKVSDAAAPIAFAGGMLTLDFTGKPGDAILSSLTVADTLRGLFQDGKISGIQLSGNGGNVISLTKQELLDYKLAKQNGQSLPDEIEALLKVLEGEEDKELPKFEVTVDKSTAMVEEWVTFTVHDTKPEYTYVWEYGGNKNPQDKNTFSYMYQVAGTYTMYVTVLNNDGEAVGKGSCNVNVVDMPTPTPNTAGDNTEDDTNNIISEINIVGTYGFYEDGCYTEMIFSADGGYTSSNSYDDSDYVYQVWGNYTHVNTWYDEESGKTYYKYKVNITQTSNGTNGVDFAPLISSDDMDASGNVLRIGDFERK